MDVKFTPIELNIMYLLSDGLPHEIDEILSVLEDPQTLRSALRMAVSNLRKKLALRGEMILCEFKHRKTHYRLVRKLTSPYDGLK